MSLIINPINTNLLMPLDTEAKSIIKKTTEGNVDAVKMQFAEIVQQPAAQSQEIVTSDEKQFFSKLFPQASTAIQSYTSYTPTGAKKPVVLGSIIDIKG